MEVSAIFRNTLQQIFRSSYYFNNSNINIRTINNRGIFDKFLEVTLNEDNTIEVPLFLRGNIDHFMVSSDLDGLAVALPILSEYNTRTADSTIKKLFNNNVSQRLIKCTTNKGEVFYGNNGFLLDSDFNILFCVMLKGTLVTTDTKSIVYNKIVIYVHPKVFTDNSLISKALLKKIIPFYATNHITVYYNSVSNTDGLPLMLPEIIIKDISNNIKHAKLSENLDTIEEDLSQILIDNLEDLDV